MSEIQTKTDYKNEKDHFDNISTKYEDAAESWNEIYDQVSDNIIEHIKGKIILDVGNGGHFSYDTTVPSKVIAMDVSPKMLERIKEVKVEKVVDDAREMNFIEDGSVDVILFQFVLHHISGSTLAKSIATMEEVIETSYKKLKPDGKLIIAEPLLSPFVFFFEKLLFPITYRILKRFDIPMIFMFSDSFLRKKMALKFKQDFQQVEKIKIGLTGWSDPLGGSFPGLIKVPPWLHYAHHRILIATKS